MKNAKIDKIWYQLNSGESFWDIVKEPYLNRDLNRQEVAEILKIGLLKEHKYKDLLKLLNIDKKEYKNFMNFIASHKLLD